MKIKNRRKGFTMVELMVVVAILAVVLGVLSPALFLHTEKSRAQKDVSAMDEVVNAVHLALSEQNCYDEMFRYSCDNNYMTYTDSSGTYGQQVQDEEFWAPDGIGCATTITFNPEESTSSTTTKYSLDKAVINNMMISNGSKVAEEREIIGQQMTDVECYLKDASVKNGSTTAYLYTKLRATIGDYIEMDSQTYRNSSFTVFIKWETKDGTVVPNTYGMFNGTNLYKDAEASLGSGTKDTLPEETPDEPVGGVVTPPEYDPDDLLGSGTQPDVDDEEIGSGNTPVPEDPVEDPEELKKASAVLYEGGLLVLQRTAEPKAKYGAVLDSFEETNWMTTEITTEEQLPWYPRRLDVRKVIVEDKIQPVSTAFWFCDMLNVKEIDISKIDTSKVTKMTGMFVNCKSLETVDVSHFNTANVTDMCSMFYECNSLKSIDVSGFNTSKVTDMSYMFYQNKKVPVIDVSGFDTRNVWNMAAMFGGCESVRVLDVSRFRTENCYDMMGMFHLCFSLTSLDVSNFETRNVYNMATMFSGVNLSQLDISNFNTSGVISFKGMFAGCPNITSLDLSNFNTARATNMSGMFKNCGSLKRLDLSSFNTWNVKDMSEMFYQSPYEYLDLSSFETTNVTTMEDMFYDCHLIKTLKLGWGWEWKGTNHELPWPSAYNHPGTTGKWYCLETGREYISTDIPNGYGTYVAVKP